MRDRTCALPTSGTPHADGWDNRPAIPRIPTQRPASPDSLTQHALTALARQTPGKRRLTAAWATNYLAQVDGTAGSTWAGTYYDPPTTSPGAHRWHRADAYEHRHGNLMARALGIPVRPNDARLPAVARAVIAEVERTVDTLTERATTTGQPAAVALLHILGHTGDSDPDMDEALRRARRSRHCPVTHGELAARARLDTLGVTL